jgi:4-amino-4-deoxy-L-arabinose transferase-like glycosyltransferase
LPSNFNLYIFIIVFYILKFFISLNFDIIPDEAYYWEWSRNLDLAYYDQGPGVAYYIKIFTLIFSDSLIALRLGAGFAGLLTTIFVIRLADLIEFSNTKKYILTGLLLLIPGFFSGSMLIMHDSPFLLFWISSLFYFSRYVKLKKNLDLYLFFITMGMGALSKHTMIFFLISIVIWSILRKEEWKVFKNTHFYLGIVLCGLIVSPILVWNIQNNWESIDAIVNLRSAGGVNSKKFNTISYFAGQFLTLSPFVFLLILIVLITNFKNYSWKSFISNDTVMHKIKQLLAINSLVLPIYFLYMSIEKTVQANWIFAAYLPASLFVAEFIADTFFAKIAYKIYYSAMIFFMVLMNTFSIFSIQIYESYNLTLNPHFVPGYRADGFLEIVQKIEEFRNSNFPNAQIIANRYQDAAIASWHSKDKPFINSLNILQKNQYNHWMKLNKGQDYILLYIEEKPCQKSFIFFQPYLEWMFESVKEFPEEEIVRNGKVIKRYQIWYLKNYLQSWVNPVNEVLLKTIIKDSLLVGLKSKSETQDENSFFKNKKPIDLTIIDNYLKRKGELECSFFQK